MFDLFRFKLLYLQLLSFSGMLVFLWRPLSIYLLKAFLDVWGIIAWKWANFFGRHAWGFSILFGSLHQSFVAWRILMFGWYYSSKIYILVWSIFIIHWVHNFILSISLNFNAKVFILPWPCHLLFWRWGFREDLMFSIVVRWVIAFCGRRKLSSNQEVVDGAKGWATLVGQLEDQDYDCQGHLSVPAYWRIQYCFV